MDIRKCYEAIDFVSRFKIISRNHNNFSSRLNGNQKKIYDKLLSLYGYNYKYFNTEKFYKIEEQNFGSTFTIHLVMKDGIIEPMLFVKYQNVYCIPDGRFDSICEDVDTQFSRIDFPIPTYSSENELKDILNEIFNLYEDFKREFLALVQNANNPA